MVLLRLAAKTLLRFRRGVPRRPVLIRGSRAGRAESYWNRTSQALDREG